MSSGKLSGVESIKAQSQGLRGSLAAELASSAVQFTDEAYNLLKFHGSYEQYDRDTATERKQHGLEKEWQCMLRTRSPGGRLTAAQYLALDALADRYGNGTLRITTRQGFQFHGVLKGDLRPLIVEINQALLTTMSACGDVVRNVTATPAPRADAKHRKLQADAALLSTALLPKSRAYYEIFIDGKEVTTAEPEDEPLYGATYLPRKFKIGLAAPEDNTIDVLSNDLALIGLFEGDRLVGYNIAVGGGLGMTHNKPHTYPRLATLVAFVTPEDMVAGVEAVIRLQRDHGDRSDRRHARLKYVVDAKGLPWIKAELDRYFGRPMEPPRPMPKLEVPEILGWQEQGDGRWWLGIPVSSGRIADEGPAKVRSAIRAIVDRFGADPILTPHQDVLLSNIEIADRTAIDAILAEHGVRPAESLSPLDRWTLACPALPTCGLALSEAERVRDNLVGEVEAALARQGLAGERLSLRITGCPNGCARSYTGDIGIVGRTANDYALFVGGDFEGTRLSFRLIDRIPLAQIPPILELLFAAFAAERRPGEGFGDFCSRIGHDKLLGLVPSAKAA
jgi:sulfite reductase (ferredoxin)